MRKLILLLCLIFVSCFKEPKKEDKEPDLNYKNEESIVELPDSSAAPIIIENIDKEYNDTLTSEDNYTDINLNTESDLDKIYLGTHLFHQGGEGTFGKVSIFKKNNYYYVVGEHKMLNADWIKIEGKILNPSIENFTFSGKITAYSPVSASIYNKYRKGDEKIYEDTCIWEGEVEARRPKDRKYWRFKPHGCYSHTGDLDIFDN